VNAAGNASKAYPVGGYPLDASPDTSSRVWWVSGTTLSYLNLGDNSTASWTVPGSDYLSGISIDASGLVWMTDQGVANVYSFNINDRNTLCTYPLTDTSSTAAYPFAVNNNLWLVDFGTSALVKLDYNTDTWTRWALPDFSSPYDLIVDPNGDIWYTDNSLLQIGQFHPTTNELHIFPIPSADSDPVMLASFAGRIWYTDKGNATLGSLDPTISPPAPETLTPSTANANSGCDRLGAASPGTTPPANGTPSWTPGTYTTLYDANGWRIYQLPAKSQPWGITFTEDGYVVDSFWQKLIHFSPSATPVDLFGFTAASTPRAIQLDWNTAQESNVIGFNLYRADTLNGLKLKLNSELNPALAPGQLMGHTYRHFDKTSKAGNTYYYWVEWVGTDGSSLFGPATALQEHYIWLPSILR